MDIFAFLKKPKMQEPFTETTFECKRGDLTIWGTEYRHLTIEDAVTVAEILLEKITQEVCL